MLNRSLEQKYKEKYLAFEKKCKRMTHQKEKHHLVLEKYFVFEWVFAKTFIIMSLLKYLHRKGRGRVYRDLISETM